MGVWRKLFVTLSVAIATFASTLTTKTVKADSHVTDSVAAKELGFVGSNPPQAFVEACRLSTSGVAVRPPIAARLPAELPSAHGKKTISQYSWLRDDTRKSAQVLAYLEWENQYADALMAPLAPLVDALRDEFSSRSSNRTEVGAALRRDGFWYYKQRTASQTYWSHHRIRVPKGAAPVTSADGPPAGLPGAQLVLDPNRLCKGLAYCDVMGVEVSPDGLTVAFGLDTSGGERYTLVLLDVATQAPLLPPQAAPKHTSGSFQWSRDSASLLYLTLAPDTQRAHELHRLTWRTGSGAMMKPPVDQVLHTESDEAYVLDLSRTSDGEYIILYSRGEVTRSAALLHASTGLLPWASATRRSAGEWHTVHTRRGQLLLLTVSDRFPAGRLTAAPLDKPDAAVVVVPQQPIGIVITGFTVTARRLVLTLRSRGRTTFAISADLGPAPLAAVDATASAAGSVPPAQPSTAAVVQLPSNCTWRCYCGCEGNYSSSDADDGPAAAARGEAWCLRWREAAYSAAGGPVVTFQQDVLRLSVSSFTLPDTVVDVDLANGVNSTKDVGGAPSGYNAALYETSLLLAPAPAGDGAVAGANVSVPVALVYRREAVHHDHSNPTLLLGYGAYGSSYDPVFNPNYFSLLDRGWVIAVAMVRGGGEFGRPWHDAGRGLHKRNSFTDFVAAAQALVAWNLTRPGRIAAWGRSAGGLLVASALNAAPEGLFGAALLDVPFTDVLADMLDPSLPLTVRERDEWGDPIQSVEAYDYIRSYSPVDCVSSGRAYPPMLVTAGLNDVRVGYWEPAKWVAALRWAKTSSAGLVALRTDMGGGHFSNAGFGSASHATAVKFAFLMQLLTPTCLQGDGASGGGARQGSSNIVGALVAVVLLGAGALFGVWCWRHELHEWGAERWSSDVGVRARQRVGQAVAWVTTVGGIKRSQYIELRDGATDDDRGAAGNSA